MKSLETGKIPLHIIKGYKNKEINGKDKHHIQNGSYIHTSIWCNLPWFLHQKPQWTNPFLILDFSNMHSKSDTSKIKLLIFLSAVCFLYTCVLLSHWLPFQLKASPTWSKTQLWFCHKLLCLINQIWHLSTPPSSTPRNAICNKILMSHIHPLKIS